MEKKQIRAIFLYEFKIGCKVTEVAYNINDAFGSGTANERTCKFRKFRNGDENLEDKERSGRPVTIDHDDLKILIETNPHTTVWELAEELGVSKSVVSDHLERIGKTKKLDKWVPHRLNENQENCRFEACSALILHNQNDSFFDHIVTCDEKWVFMTIVDVLHNG